MTAYPNFSSVVLDRMAAEDRDLRFAHFVGPAGEELVENFRAELRIEAQDSKGEKRLRTHGIDIAESVGSGYLTEDEGVVHDRGEEIDGLNEGGPIVEQIHSGIVGRFIADQDVGIAGRRLSPTGLEAAPPVPAWTLSRRRRPFRSDGDAPVRSSGSLSHISP